MILRTICCDVCKAESRESEPGAGFPGWGGIKGVELNKVVDPNFCPQCLALIMNFIEVKIAQHVS